MNVKFMNMFLDTGCILSSFVKTNRRTLRVKYQFQVQFCSDQSKNESGEARIKKMLDDASPLKQTLINEDLLKSVYKIPTPEETSVIMFPGQGNQFVGMAKNIIKYPVARDMFLSASEILHYDLLKVCMEGPEEKLNHTEFCQPATFVCSLAALEKLKEENSWAINNCVAACGYSLGEFSALVFAGCLNFEQALKLVDLRAKAMSVCCGMAKSGMMTVLYGPGSTLTEALNDAINHCKENGIEDPVCSVATYLFPNCKVIGGHMKALDFIIENSKKYRLRKLSKLPVSGAFHTVLMKEAGETFKEILRNQDFKDPLIKVYSNIDGKVYRNGEHVKKRLPRQIYMPVKWEQTMQYLFERPRGVGFPYVYECGPGNSLITVLKKKNYLISDSCFSVQL